MKRVIIGEKCIGCGICLHNKKYIEETTDGIARAIPGMMVTDKDLPDLEEIERICPIHELHLSPLKKETVDSRVLSESKERLLEEMRDFRDHFKLKRPGFHPIPGMTSPTFRLIMTIRKKHFPPGTTQTRLSGNASRTMSMMKTSAA